MVNDKYDSAAKSGHKLPQVQPVAAAQTRTAPDQHNRPTATQPTRPSLPSHTQPKRLSGDQIMADESRRTKALAQSVMAQYKSGKMTAAEASLAYDRGVLAIRKQDSARLKHTKGDPLFIAGMNDIASMANPHTYTGMVMHPGATVKATYSFYKGLATHPIRTFKQHPVFTVLALKGIAKGIVHPGDTLTVKGAKHGAHVVMKAAKADHVAPVVRMGREAWADQSGKFDYGAEWRRRNKEHKEHQDEMIRQAKAEGRLGGGSPHEPGEKPIYIPGRSTRPPGEPHPNDSAKLTTNESAKLAAAYAKKAAQEREARAHPTVHSIRVEPSVINRRPIIQGANLIGIGVGHYTEIGRVERAVGEMRGRTPKDITLSHAESAAALLEQALLMSEEYTPHEAAALAEAFFPHDIGKNVSAAMRAIVAAPTRDIDYGLMNRHDVLGSAMLRARGVVDEAALDFAKYHHHPRDILHEIVAHLVDFIDAASDADRLYRPDALDNALARMREDARPVERSTRPAESVAEAFRLAREGRAVPKNTSGGITATAGKAITSVEQAIKSLPPTDITRIPLRGRVTYI